MKDTITTISRFLADFWSGRLDESFTHWVLIGVVVAAELSLGIGIWIESPKIKTRREWAGVWLVLGGCVISALFTVLLLMFDEGISRDQKATIASLNEQIAPRHLTTEEESTLSQSLSKFIDGERRKSELTFGVGPFSLSPEKTHVDFSRAIRVESYTLDPESAALGQQLVDVLSQLEHVLVENGLLTSTPFRRIETGVHVYGEDKELAAAILAALPERLIPTDKLPTLGGASLNVVVDSVAPAVTIFIGAKPLPK